MKFLLIGRVTLFALLLSTSVAYAADSRPSVTPATTPSAQVLAPRPGHAGIASANFHATEAGL